MKILMFTMDQKGNVCQMHRLLQKWIGVKEIVGENINMKLSSIPLVNDFLSSLKKSLRSRKNQTRINLSFTNEDFHLFNKLQVSITIEVSKILCDDEAMIYGYVEDAVELKYLTDLVSQKDDLLLKSLKLLSNVSKEVQHEPFSKVASRKILDALVNLVDAKFAIYQTYHDSKADICVSCGLTSEFLRKYYELIVEPIPLYQKTISTMMPFVDEDPRKNLGFIFEDLNDITPLEMTVCMPLIQNRVIKGFLILGFDEKKPLLYECMDILENFAREFDGILEKNDYYHKILNSAEKLKKLSVDVVTSLSNAVETRDSYNNGHSERVAIYAVEIARNMGWDDYELEKIRIAGALHDIGKVGIPDSVLLKPTELNKHEYEIVKLHPDLSANIIAKIENYQDIVPWVRYHHEDYNGCGYPYGLKGNEIPMGSRILAVADTFDAMTSSRPYRSALTKMEVEAILRRGVGIQWDEMVVNTAIQSLDIIYEKAKKYFPTNDKLEEYRKSIFNISLMSGLYLYEYMYQEMLNYIEGGKKFSAAEISLKNSIVKYDPETKKSMINSLIEMVQAEFHYPILAARKSYFEIMIFAPLVEKEFLNGLINRLKNHFFEKNHLTFEYNIVEFPKENKEAIILFEHSVDDIRTSMELDRTQLAV